MNNTDSNHLHIKHSILAFTAAAVWGFYWYPLRKIEDAGIPAAWATLAIYLAPFLFLSPLCFIRRTSLLQHWRGLVMIGAIIGAALACYATAFLHTSVLRTVLLFYMTPVWSTLLGLVFLNEKNNPRRWIAMVVGFGGLALMLSNSGQSAAQPFGLGDIAALLSGVLWGAGTVLIKKKPNIDSSDIVPVQYFFAMLVSGVFLLFGTNEAAGPLPPASAWIAAMPSILLFYILIIPPTIFICIRAAQVLSPGRVGILMMSEVLVAGITAPLLAGEVLSGKEWVAAGLILAAGIIEVTTAHPVEPIPD